MNVLWLSPEVAPWSKTGGLGDVAGALPAALVQSGRVRVTVLSPRYRDLRCATPLVRVPELDRRFRLGEHVLDGRAWSDDPAAPLRHLFLECGELFDRPGIYGEHQDGYPDNAWRYGAFCRYAVELIPTLAPDVIHASDWQSGFLFAYPSALAGIRSVFTIHNLLYQGRFSVHEWHSQGLATPEIGADAEFWGTWSTMKLALRRADAITTVSPTYAREICTPAFGFGMQDVLANDVRRLRGILNGIDPSWDPGTDPSLPARYGADDLRGKATCRAHLVEHAGFDEADGHLPIVAMIARLTPQKGVDLAFEAVSKLLAEGRVRFALLGQGRPHLEDAARALQAAHPRRCHVHIGYSEHHARLLEAGADMFLMPSRFEPCGLNQMYSMRYGTPPIVHRTGGLADTVRDADHDPAHGTGFVFSPDTADALQGALDRAIRAFADPERWHSVMQNAMRQDFRWARSADEVIDLYGDLVSLRTSP